MGKRPPITNRVRELREENARMRQAALGEAVGVTRHTLIAIEQGRYSPRLEPAFRIARLFGVGVEDVFGWEGECSTKDAFAGVTDWVRGGGMPDDSSLPIHAVLPQLKAALAGGPNAVLVAPPGAGKTTAVAPALLAEDWCTGECLLLSPRRVAARAAAVRMAALLGE